MEELLKPFEEQLELGHEVEVMWARGAAAQKVTDMLSGKGVGAEPAQVEKLLAAMQARHAEAIGDGEKLDTDQLKRVAGRRCAFWQENQGNLDTCTNRFKNYDTTSLPGRRRQLGMRHLRPRAHERASYFNWNSI